MPHDSYERLEQSLREFAGEADPGAKLLRGEWGVGKTYACLQALKAKTSKEQKAFSYVSLYGVSKLEDIYARIALGWNNPITEAIPDWLKEAVGAKGAIKSIADIFKLGTAAEAIGAAGVGLLARNALIVIDDLERRDDKLSVKAALGVVSYLVETRKCRVIFISNDGALSEEDRKVFDEHKEKVFDSEYFYSPTVEENIRIFAGNNSKYLRQPLQALEIRNLRVIKRANRCLDAFQKHLKPASQRANEVVLRNAAILSIIYHGYRSTVKLASRKEVNYLGLVGFDDTSKFTESDKIFSKASYFEGPADDEIASYLETGLVDWDALNEKLKGQERYFEQEEAKNHIQGVFRKVYGNFIAQTDEVIQELETACNKNAELLPPSSLKLAGEILADLGKPVDAGAWLTRWENENLPILSDHQLHEITSGINSCPDSVRIKARAEEVRRRGKPTIHDTLTRRFRNEAYPRSWIQEIADFPESDYQKWLENSDSEYLRSLVSEVFEQFYGKGGPEGTIAEKTLKAVEVLEEKSVINRFRVRILKNSLPPPTAPRSE